jgi:hypothetical protein
MNILVLVFKDFFFLLSQAAQNFNLLKIVFIKVNSVCDLFILFSCYFRDPQKVLFRFDKFSPP